MVGANSIDALIGMGKIDALEVVAHPRQIAETLIVDAPVGEHFQERREDVERSSSCIGLEESWHHNIGTILVDGSVFGVEGAAHACSLWIADASVLVFYALLIDTEVILELLKGLAIIAIACISDACECRTDANGSHVERTAMGRRYAVHVLNALVAIVSTAHVKVYLEVCEGLKRHLNLYVLSLGNSGRCGYAVASQQPAAAFSLIEITVVHKTKCEIESRSKHASNLPLTEHIAHFGEEARYRKVVGIAIGDADVSHHHKEACCGLCQSVPFLFGGLGQSDDIEANTCSIDGSLDDTDSILVHLLIFNVIGKAATVASCHTNALGLLSVSNDEIGIGIEGNLLYETLRLTLLRADACHIALLDGSLLSLSHNAVHGLSGFHRLLFCFLASALLLLLFGFLVLILLLLFSTFLVGAVSGIGGREALVGFLQELAMIIEFLEVYLAIDVNGTLRIDGIPE